MGFFDFEKLKLIVLGPLGDETKDNLNYLTTLCSFGQLILTPTFFGFLDGYIQLQPLQNCVFQ